MAKITVELTDTYGGQANYSWVRHFHTESASDSRLAIVRAAKRVCGFNGLKANVEEWGELIVIKPRGYNQVCFVTVDYE